MTNISQENLELLKQAQLEWKTVEQIVAEAEEIKTNEDRKLSERTTAITKLNTLISKINLWEYDNSIENLNLIIARELLDGTVYKIIDATPREEVEEEDKEEVEEEVEEEETL